MNQQTRQLFHELLELPPGERQRVLAGRNITPEVRAEVESLLRFDPADAVDLTDLVSGAAEELIASQAPPAPVSCGPYRLLRPLGSGGMGAVYLAERADGEIQQQVAVKLLRADGHRPAWRERFLRERQILASLRHPSIVHVIDAGHTGDGRPYLVMEHVEGVPVDVYAAGLPLRGKLELFVKICEAVAHAHSNLVVHRDLKPSNILVDASGRPKLLDFGIAKLLDADQDQAQTVELLLTPEYASPEQFRGAIQTTATDIYSLGAVLYKLLTGSSPHGPGCTTREEMAAAVCSKDPAPASSLNRGLPRDLDFVLAKALRQEPKERYASADAFANDLRAFLEWRPVRARSGNAWYRTRKFLRRYWVPVSAAALVILTLSAALFEVNRERVVAQRRFQQLKDLSNRILDLDLVLRELPGSTQARQSVVSASLEYLEGLVPDARGDLDLTQELADAYSRVAGIQGVPVELNLGQRDQAEASLKKAGELISQVLAAHPTDRKALFRAAIVANNRMILAQDDRRDAEAAAFGRESAQRAEEYLRIQKATDDEIPSIAGLFTNIALMYVNLHHYSEAIPYAQRGVDLTKPISSARFREAQGLSLLANALRYQGDLNGSLAAIQEARQMADASAYRNESERMVDRYGILLREGLILGGDGDVNLNRPAEAAEALQAALDLVEDGARQDPKDAVSRGRVATSARELGRVLRRRDPQRALAAYNLGLQRLGEIPASLRTRRDRAAVLADSSYVLQDLHRSAEARQRLDESLALLMQTKDLPAPHLDFDSAAYAVLMALADQDAAAGAWPAAIGKYQDLLGKLPVEEPLADLRNAPRLSALYEALARAYRRTGQPGQAADMEARRVDLWHHWDRNLPNNAFVRSQIEAASLR